MARRSIGIVLFCIFFAVLTLISLNNWFDRACRWYVSSRIESIAANPEAMEFSHHYQYIKRNRTAYYQIFNMGDRAIHYLDTIMEQDSQNGHHGLRYFVAGEIRRNIINREDFFARDHTP